MILNSWDDMHNISSLSLDHFLFPKELEERKCLMIRRTLSSNKYALKKVVAM